MPNSETTPQDASTVATPLIGSDDIATPYWAEAYEEQAKAGAWAIAKAAPAIVAVLGSWAWRASPVLTVFTATAQLMTAAATAFGLLATASVFTGILASAPAPDRVVAAVPALAQVIAAVILRGLLLSGVGAVQATLIPRIVQQAQDELYAALLEADLLAFDDPDFTALVERVAQRSLVLIRQGAKLVSDLLAAMVSIISAVYAAGILHPLLALLVVFTALPQAWASLQRAHVQLVSFLRTSAQQWRQDVIRDLISSRRNAAEIRAFTAQRILREEHRRITSELTRELVDVEKHRNLLIARGRGLSALAAGIAYVVLGLLIYKEALPLALAGTAVIVMRTSAQALSTGIYAINDLFEIGTYIRLYRTLMVDIRNRQRPQPTRQLIGEPQVIELKDVSFRYPYQANDALSGIDLVLHRGEVIALVGENGSGKTTLAKLISGLYAPYVGTVKWDGVSIDAVAQQEVHEHVSFVLQEPMRWPMTAEMNVRIGRLDRRDPRDEIFAESTTASGADEILVNLPRGRDTLISPAFKNGRDLSGGEWQRIGVARGLYRSAPLVVADEPSAAMDARAELAVFNAFRSLSLRGNGVAGHITVLITHRLANVRCADKIVVLDKGKIVEMGTHDELIANAGKYHELFILQAQAYQK
jgi:ATP-binding cassette subfamily B protein